MQISINHPNQLFFVLCSVSTLVEATCYYPDQSVAPYRPCNSTVGVGSACCGSKDACSTSGLCFGSAGFMYRGGCTAKDWNAEACSSQCRDCDFPTPHDYFLCYTFADSIKVALNSFSNIYPCPIVNGSFPNNALWCCGASEGTDAAKAGCCYTSTFSPFIPGFAFLPADKETNALSSAAPSVVISSSYVVVTSSVTTPTISTVLPISTPTPHRVSATSEKTLAVGAGVGAPLGALLLSGLCIFLIQKHRRRVFAKETIQTMHTPNGAGVLEQSEENHYELNLQPKNQELKYTNQYPRELHSRTVLESGAQH